jgi:hypothetical protein
MNDNDIREIAAAAIAAVNAFRQTNTSNSNGLDKSTTLYFQPTQQYADSFARYVKEGTGFMGLGKPNVGAPIKSAQINITLRNGLGGVEGNWVGYSLDINNPETDPAVSLFRQWPITGGEFDADPSLLATLKPHLVSLLAGALTPGNTEPPREAPEGMF